MDGIAERMKSKDFGWVVMAIRIQREVGGNLAELLTTVSGTLRERERLRRQVQVLSAEGRLSAWILGLLPIVFSLYLALVRPSYLKPLVGEVMGWLLLSFGATLLIVGALWLRKVVKVEV
jgi:tight adherence protein B